MRVNKYLPFAIIYFFLNSVGLPFGLTYMALLAPLFYWWIVSVRKAEVLLPFLMVLFPFVFMQVNFVGVDTKVYIVSFLNLVAVYIFCQAFYTFLKQCENPGKIWTVLLIINFILCLIAIPFYFSNSANAFWIQQEITDGVKDFKRLKLFTYEASYYATLFVPLFFFFLVQIIQRQNKISAWWLFLLISLPLLMSFSIGVMSCIILSLFLVLVFHFASLIRKRRVLNLSIIFTVLVLPAIALFIYYFPDNTLFFRLQNIFSGQDTSGEGRTTNAFVLANKILDLKNHTWGIGPGQIKIVGAETIRDYYLYTPEYNTIAIPNATAETWALFGWLGICLRLGVEIFLFFYTKVWTNYYRLLLFIFIFIYQLTGSFITNVAEYVIWILAFTAVFKEFDVRSSYQRLALN